MRFSKKTVEKETVESKKKKVSRKPKIIEVAKTEPESELVLNPSADTLPVNIRDKVLRRAKRHFDGKNVKHRVVQKDANSITFAFNRMSHKYSELGMNTKITVSRVVKPVLLTVIKPLAKTKPTKATKKPISKSVKTDKKPVSKKSVKSVTEKPSKGKSTNKPTMKKSSKIKESVTRERS